MEIFIDLLKIVIVVSGLGAMMLLSEYLRTKPPKAH